MALSARALALACVALLAPLTVPGIGVAQGAPQQAAVDASDLDAATDFHWGSANLTGPTVVRFAFDLGADARCTYDAAIATVGEQHRTGALMLLMKEGWIVAMGAGGSFDLVRVQAGAGAVDSRSLTGGSAGTSAMRFWGTIDLPAGRFEFALASPMVGVWENVLTGLDAMRLSLVCDGPLALAEVARSDEVLFTDDTAAPLAGARVFPLSGAAVGASASRTFASPEVLVVASFNGAGVVRFTLERPDGNSTTSFVSLGSGAYSTAGGHGEWGYTYDTAGNVHVLGVIMGLLPLQDGLDGL